MGGKVERTIKAVITECQYMKKTIEGCEACFELPDDHWSCTHSPLCSPTGELSKEIARNESKASECKKDHAIKEERKSKAWKGAGIHSYRRRKRDEEMGN